MNDHKPVKLAAFLNSSAWSIAFTQGDLNAQVTVIETFLSELDSDVDTVDIHYTLNWLFNTYATHGAVQDAVQVLARMDDIQVSADEDLIMTPGIRTAV